MRERLSWFGWFVLGAVLMIVLAGLTFQLPAVKDKLEWRVDAASGIVRGWLNPGDMLPAPTGVSLEAVVPTAVPSHTAGPTEVVEESPTPLPTATPLPQSVALPSPRWEKQDWNNCGPATLALALRTFGWSGDQFDVSDLLKPDRGDKNVNVDELVYYVRTQAGWLQAGYRVGGDIDTLKRFLAAGYPVIVEKGFILRDDEGGGGWTGHYALVTAYDDRKRVFTIQDSYNGPDLEISYTDLDEGWKAFNRVFILIYPVDEGDAIAQLLGDDADLDLNREKALEYARAEIEKDPSDAFAWFNLGTNLVYFERYAQASEAYDRALVIGLPWRFTRFQFGPYIANYHQGRFQDVIDLADTTLRRTPKAEESLLWRGWARYRLGNLQAAIEDWQAALQINPYYFDALYALDYVGAG